LHYQIASNLESWLLHEGYITDQGTLAEILALAGCANLTANIPIPGSVENDLVCGETVLMWPA